MPIRAGRIVLDMDSSESPVHGEQEGSAYNGHFEYGLLPPAVSVQLNTATASPPCCGPATCRAPRTGTTLLLPELDRQQAEGKRVAFRADAAFARSRRSTTRSSSAA